MITEIAFYLPDAPGQFAKSLRILEASEINIWGFSVDLAGPYSEVRMVCSDADQAMKELEAHGYVTRPARVFLLSLPHIPGQLLRVATILGNHGVNIKYGYCILGL